MSRRDTAVTVRDHRVTPGLPPPPRVHVEPFGSADERARYVRALRLTLTASGAVLETTDGGASYDVYAPAGEPRPTPGSNRPPGSGPAPRGRADLRLVK